jgi:rhodanese-related sulfurtransferase
MNLREFSRTSFPGQSCIGLLLKLLCLSGFLGISGQIYAEEKAPYGMTAEAAHALLQEKAAEILFVDVRDPVEIQFVGFTDWVDINIPFLLVDRSRWLKSEAMFAMPRNENFTDEIREALEARGLDPEATIITMCRTGSSRGEPSAAFLRQAGFPNSRFIINGFQGEALEEGMLKGHRIKNGWQNSGLPWSPAINGDKIYRP